MPLNESASFLVSTVLSVLTFSTMQASEFLRDI